MADYIDREEYCEKHCRCSNEYCDRQSCPIWKAPAADVARWYMEIGYHVLTMRVVGAKALRGAQVVGRSVTHVQSAI